MKHYIRFWLKVISLILLWGVLLPRFVHAQAGTPDPSFGGGDGYSVESFLQNGHSYPNAIAVQSNGRIVVAGETWIPNGTANGQIALVRYMPNGSPDPTFGSNGKATNTLANMGIGAAAVVIQPDGKILCAGSAWDGTKNYCALFRFNADGAPDNSFDGDGILITQASNLDQGFSAMALQTDGKIIVGGYANVTGYDEFAMLRFKPNGALDGTFGGDGIITTPVGESYSSIQGISIQPDGKIIGAGYAVQNGFEDFAVARYNTNGALDHSFSGDGIAFASFSDKNDRAHSVALQSDGKIVLAGYASGTPPATYALIAVARFNTSGNLDSNFGSGDGLATMDISDKHDNAECVVIQPDGKILLGGSSQQWNPSQNSSPYQFTIARMTTQGLPDASFGSGTGFSILSVATNGDFIHAMTLQTDGKVLVAGDARYGDFDSFVVARFITGVTVDTTNPNVFSSEVSLFPNPVTEQTTLEFELQTPEKITLNLYDMQGRFIQNLLPPTEKTAGKHHETLHFSPDIPSGTYLLSIESPNFHTVIKAIF